MKGPGQPSGGGAQRLLWVLAAAMAFWLAGGGAAQAQTDPRNRQRLAREHIARAEKQYQISNFPEALAEFQAAYRLDPRPELLFNLARCYEVMARLEEAITYYQRYLAARPGARDRGLVEARLANLRTRRQREAEAAAPPASANARAGRRPPSQPAPPQALTPVPPPVSVSRRTGYRAAGWTMLGVGAASLASGVVFGALAQSEASEFNAAVKEGKTYSTLERIRDRGSTYQSLQIATLVTAGVLAAAGGGLLFWAYREGSDQVAYLAPAAAPGTVGLSGGGTF